LEIGLDNDVVADLKLMKIKQWMEKMKDLEVHHPRCVGSITKNFVYYTYKHIYKNCLTIKQKFDTNITENTNEH